ncbi:MAG: lactate utilization protein [Bacteroidales bacterium]
METEKLLHNLLKRNFDAAFFETRQEAVQWLLAQMEEKKSVTWGGSLTLNEIGIKEALRERNITILERDMVTDAEEKHRLQRETFFCDYYLMSTSAITEDGVLVNIDGTGNRLAALMYGPDKVFVVAGINKVFGTEEEALHAVRNNAAPWNAARLNRKTPCASTGYCHDCLTSDCVCSHIVITRRSWHKERITVVLINEKLGK